MTSKTELYFNWLVDKIASPAKQKRYSSLLEYLFDTPFYYVLDYDMARANDGIELRYQFGIDYYIPQPEIAYFLDKRDCSCLEMMTALAIKTNSNFTATLDEDDGVKRWFWEMLYNLGLKEFDNENFDVTKVDYILSRFMTREYSKNGEGGLFVVPDGPDMRHIEIWRQLCLYLNIIFEGEEDEQTI